MFHILQKYEEGKIFLFLSIKKNPDWAGEVTSLNHSLRPGESDTMIDAI